MPKARLTWAKRGVPSRDHAAEGTGVDMPGRLSSVRVGSRAYSAPARACGRSRDGGRENRPPRNAVGRRGFGSARPRRGPFLVESVSDGEARRVGSRARGGSGRNRNSAQPAARRRPASRHSRFDSPRPGGGRVPAPSVRRTPNVSPTSTVLRFWEGHLRPHRGGGFRENWKKR